MSDATIIPMWLYERLVASKGKETADAMLASLNVMAVGSWEEAVDLEAVKERVNHG